MKRLTFLLLPFLAATARAFLLSAPDAPTFHAEPTAWEQAHAFVENGSAVGALTEGTGAEARRVEPASHDPRDAIDFSMPDTLAGYTVERTKPQYWIGDRLAAPDGTDWDETYRLFLERDGTDDTFLFNRGGEAVYALHGGTHKFVWALTDGSTRTDTYIVATASRNRPYRIFWTDEPYDCPAVSLKGKFVKLLGNDDILHVEFGVTEQVVGGVPQTFTNIVRGVYVDSGSDMLYAVGGVEGQFVMAYYDSGDMTRLLSVIVVEVCRPEVIQMTGTIGTAVKPFGSGYNPDGLKAYPTLAKGEQDEFGPYYYQHVGPHPYSPNNGAVYPLRPTVGQQWRLEVCWKETDPLGTLWPFECCQYSCDWPDDMQIFVRSRNAADPGLPMSWESAFSAELMKYQDPNGHASAIGGSATFSSTGEGRSLIKFATADNVWFLPVRSVFRDNPDYFTLVPEKWLVGDEIIMRGGSVAGTAPGFVPNADASVPGYVYEPESGDQYNPLLYVAQTAEDARTNEQAAASVIYPVAAGTKPIEVWWSSNVRLPDMPSAIRVPSLVQRYAPQFPTVEEAPRIVLASGLGSGIPCVWRQGIGLLFDAPESTADLPNRTFFSDDGGTVAFWTTPGTSDVSRASALLGLGGATNEELSISFDAKADGAYEAKLTAGGTGLRLSTPVVNGRDWVHLALSFCPTGTVLYLDGRAVDSADLPGAIAARFNAFLENNTIGARKSNGAEPVTEAACGRMIDEIVAFRRPLSAAEIDALRLRSVTAIEPGLTLSVPFLPDIDLNPEADDPDKRYATDILTGHRSVYCHHVLGDEPAAPRRSVCLLASDEPPTVYHQPDPDATGYNPNNEHAFVLGGGGAYTVWALRTDLPVEGQTNGVLVTFRLNGRPYMQYFAVLETDEDHPALAGAAEAGRQLPGPHPFDLLPNPWRRETFWDGDAATTPAWRDRKLQIWARCAGTLPIHMYYPMQEGFWFPSLSEAEQPAPGTPIPWLACRADPEADPLTAPPAIWTWTVRWPATVPEMRIGQTLTEAAGGLPEVWDAASMAVAYPDPVSKDTKKTASLVDPTVIQATGSASYESPVALAEAFGFHPGGGGNVTLRRGRYYFNDAPPTLAERLYIDTTRDAKECLCLEGQRTGGGATVPILLMNVLSQAERDAVAALATENAAAWKTLVAGLAKEPVVANTYEYTTGGSASLHANQTTVHYKPVDHYALAARGGTNYVTIVENDNPDEDIVPAGNPVAMHVFRIIPEYYAGSVVTREDPVNLLSQQLDVLYTEPFGGAPDDFRFRWSARFPSAPDFSEYKTENGLTRFTIGTEGDTLAEMVNRYFTVQYQALPGTLAHETMGDAWSPVCGPALAEGWVQRVLNAITPFTQKMPDLYDNPAETVVSMIRQAGGPFEGAIALTQDNLGDVGLIELYRTILDKAESMSILQGPTTTDANDQLLLAAERLADLYQILGDEAYTDALNPTIGFGSEFPGLEDHSLGIDYGAASSALFCFDNQVPTLLDEELALLRGRPTRSGAPVYNRLLWNFTRGMNAGEVAYAVNYNINGSSGSIDADEAAVLYPQGHGDAWGHYLSALDVYYRLLRNPNFAWGKAHATEMNVGDFATAVDYKDEQRFADIAAAAAKTAAATVDRTARKAWTDNGGAAGAGYLDADEESRFGYGEWATRGGIGTLADWVVANSLLPEPPTANAFHQFRFEAPETGETDKSGNPVYGSAYIGAAVPGEVSPKNGKDWTFELQIEPVGALPTDCIPVLWSDGYTTFSIALSPERDVTLLATTWDGTTETTNYFDEAVLRLEDGKRYLFAVSYDAAEAALRTRILDAGGAPFYDRILPGASVSFEDESFLSLGLFLNGGIHEVRFWNVARSNVELYESRFGTAPETAGLGFCLRTFARFRGAASIADEKAAIEWKVSGGSWSPLASAAFQAEFDDEGLDHIDRRTVTGLADMADAFASIQEATDRADRGLNPLGLAAGSVPFDLTPLGLEDGSMTHFEQILARAETALANAGTVLDRAQTFGSRLRQIEEAAGAATEQNEATEASYTSQLIEIYGYPYAGDIGPGGTYPQGYDGPDLVNFMWMDLADYGIGDIDLGAPTNVTCTYSLDGVYGYKQKSGSIVTNTVKMSAYGIVMKPDNVTGTRRAVGEIQRAYADFVLAYLDLLGAAEVYERHVAKLANASDVAEYTYGATQGLGALKIVREAERGAAAITKGVIDAASSAFAMSALTVSNVTSIVSEATPEVIVAGLAVGNDIPGKIVKAAELSASLATLYGLQVAQTTLGKVNQALDYADQVASFAINNYEYGMSMKLSEYDAKAQVRSAIYDQFLAAMELEGKWAELTAKSEVFTQLAAKGERLQEQRRAVRARMASTATRLRYDDMFFRLARNKALARYDKAFALAQKYAFLAAQAYDYETAQLPEGDAKADEIRTAIIAARAVGARADDGSPMLGDGIGDPGLSDVLARLRANWLVLKPRLGINNPEKQTTWFSLRRELFRIQDGAIGADDWRHELEKYWVDDLRKNTDFRRYCQPFFGSGASASHANLPEPGLVIPFSTTVDFAKNFFGNDLRGGDSAFDSTYFATRIAALGIRFRNYNAAPDGTPTASPRLSATPNVYLIPVGTDNMRVPGSTDGSVRSYTVVDQVVPAPFQTCESDLDSEDWTPQQDGYTGGVDPAVRLRRYPSFRAGTKADGSDADISSTRLLGRSVWNTRWVLIIPAGTLSGTLDRETALRTFIEGADLDCNGVREVSGVTDIELGLRTYSMSGN